MNIDIKEVNEAVVDFCIETIEKPFLHYSENDLHMNLIEKLNSKSSINRVVETKINKGKNSETCYKTKLLHKEYPSGCYGDKTVSGNFDICIFSDDDAKKIDDTNMKIDSEYITPQFAFEMGSEKIGEDSATSDHVKRDIEKLKNTKEKGFLIHVFRDETKSPSNTARRRHTEEKIENIKKIFSDLEEIPNHIVVISILLSPFRNEIKKYSSCEIFNNETGLWAIVEISRVKDYLNSHLSY